MKLVIDKNKQYEATLDDVSRIEVWVSEDKCFKINFDKFGELVVNKQTYDDESSTIIIKPNVSNQIHLIR